MRIINSVCGTSRRKPVVLTTVYGKPSLPLAGGTVLTTGINLKYTVLEIKLGTDFFPRRVSYPNRIGLSRVKRAEANNCKSKSKSFHDGT